MWKSTRLVNQIDEKYCILIAADFNVRAGDNSIHGIKHKISEYTPNESRAIR